MILYRSVEDLIFEKEKILSKPSGTHIIRLNIFIQTKNPLESGLIFNNEEKLLKTED